MISSASSPSSGAALADADARRRPRGNSSYVSGITDDPLRFVTVSQALDEMVLAHGGRAAAIFSIGREVLTWKDLQRQSDEVAAALLGLGLRRGSRVGIWSANRREWLITQLGAARIGAVLVNINAACERTELEFALNKLRCGALILARTLQSADRLGLLRGLAPELDRPGDQPVLDSRRLPHLKHVIVMGEGLVPARAQRFSDFVRRATVATRRRLPALAASLDPDDAINVQFTSGVTGVPKAVTLSHFSIVNNARYAARAMQLAEVDKLCIAVPLHQGLGMVLGVLACVASGATMVFPGEVFEPLRTLEAISRHRCTALHGSPGMFEALLDHPEREHYDMSSLRTGIVAGEPCSMATMLRVVEELCMDEVTVAYGAGEAGAAAFQSGIDDPLELRAETVGRVHPNIEAKIVDREGHIVPVGCRGELCIRGYSVMRGYWDEAKRTRDAFDANGWLRSGDLATLDAQGYCRILGRVKDVLVRGGQHLWPDEIEQRLRSHPKVEDALVFGVPDARQEDDICAWIVLKPGASTSAQEISAFCRSRIGPDGVPRYVRFVPAFPVNAAGKVQKAAMRATTLRELGAEEAKAV